MTIAVDPNYDKAQRKISTANLAQFAGVDCQLLVQKQTHRPVIMNGSTLGGAFKCASLDEVSTQLQPYLTKTQASSTYLGKTAKAASAKVADSANSVAGANVTGTVANATHAVSAGTATKANNADNAAKATSATKATQDGSGNVITSTYATKTEVNKKAPAYRYGTNDMTPGSTALATGVLYFMYQ